ncbi:MAG: hypothetical protein WC564_04430 [Patescibacteria group bacterium]
MSLENKLADGAKKSSIKDWAKKHKVLTGIIILILFIIIGKAIGGDDKNQAKTENVGQTNKAAEQAQEQQKEKVWTSVFKTSITADKQTGSFKLEGGQQKLIYKSTGGDYSMCMVYVMGEGSTLEKNGGIPTVSITGSKQDETMMRKSSGEYYLDVKSANGNCDIEIQELR